MRATLLQTHLPPVLTLNAASLLTAVRRFSWCKCAAFCRVHPSTRPHPSMRRRQQRIEDMNLLPRSPREVHSCPSLQQTTLGDWHPDTNGKVQGVLMDRYATAAVMSNANCLMASLKMALLGAYFFPHYWVGVTFFSVDYICLENFRIGRIYLP